MEWMKQSGKKLLWSDYVIIKITVPGLVELDLLSSLSKFDFTLQSPKES